MCDYFEEIKADEFAHFYKLKSFLMKDLTKNNRFLGLKIIRINSQNDVAMWKSLSLLSNVRKLELVYDFSRFVSWKGKLDHVDKFLQQNSGTLREFLIYNVVFVMGNFFKLFNKNNISLFVLGVEGCLFDDLATRKFAHFLEQQTAIRYFSARYASFSSAQEICKKLESCSNLSQIAFGPCFIEEQKSANKEELLCWKKLCDSTAEIVGFSVWVRSQVEADFFCDEIVATRRRIHQINIESFCSGLHDPFVKVLDGNNVLRLSIKGFSPFLNVLSCNTSLRHLSLSYIRFHGIDDDDFEKSFKSFVAVNKNLKSFHIANCQVDIIRLCSSVRKSQSLTKFIVEDGSVYASYLRSKKDYLIKALTSLVMSTSLQHVSITHGYERIVEKAH
jgi:hypothetical protein